MDSTEYTKLVTALFAVLTARLEDAAEIAVEGQDDTKIASAYPRASQLISIGREVAIVAEAVAALASVEQATG